MDLKSLNRLILRFIHEKLRPRCVFDSANGFDIIEHAQGDYWYWLRCKCGRRRRFKDRTNGDRLLADILFSELGLSAVMEEVDRGL